MEGIEGPVQGSGANEGCVERLGEQELKNWRNRTRGLEIRLCNLEQRRAEPLYAIEMDQIRRTIVDLQNIICETELAGRS